MESIIKQLPETLQINNSSNEGLKDDSVQDNLNRINLPKDEGDKRRRKMLYRPHTPNLLSNVYTLTEQFPALFKEKVCEECNWSVPTFYRKMRYLGKIRKDKKKTVPAISNAEKDKIIDVLDQVCENMQNRFDEIREQVKRKADRG